MAVVLTDKKAKALELLMQGVGVCAIAEEVGINRRTLYNWIKSDTAFKKAKKEIEDNLVRDLYAITLMQFEDIIVNGTKAEQIQAGTQIIKILKGDTVDVNVKPITVDDIIKNLKKY